MSGMIIVHNILKFYCELLLEKNSETPISSLEFLPSVEDFCFPHGLGEIDSSKFLKNPTLTKDPHPQLLVQKSSKLDEKINYPLFYDGTEENFNKLRITCKQEGFTVGNVLMAAYYFALAKLSVNFFNGEKLSFPLCIDINLRDRMERLLGKNHISLMIAIAKMNHELSFDTKFYDL